jgi:hypothetical protein
LGCVLQSSCNTSNIRTRTTKRSNMDHQTFERRPPDIQGIFETFDVKNPFYFRNSTSNVQASTPKARYSLQSNFNLLSASFRLIFSTPFYINHPSQPSDISSPSMHPYYPSFEWERFWRNERLWCCSTSFENFGF